MMTSRKTFDHPNLKPVGDWLRCYRERTDASAFLEHSQFLSLLKREVVLGGDQALAKDIWILETISRIQHSFLSAFHKIQASQFTAAWQCLDGCENGLSHLGNHLVEEDDEFGIEHARVHNQQFQELYPIEIGFSPGYLRKGFRCSICGTRKIPGGGCDHKAGEIYDGEFCGRELVDLDILHIIPVRNPAQNYSVIFPNGNNDRRFELVKFVVDALGSPWDRWSLSIEDRKEFHPAFEGVKGDDICPCGSSLSYSYCCLEKETVFPHYQFAFDEEPQIELPRLKIYPGRGLQDKES